jgi:inner membrane protein
MDPVTHTLVGASLAESGLKRKTALGMATLLIAANLPDIDVLSQLWGNETALWFRRGVTHGVLAVAILPPVLTGVMLLWDRVVRHRGGRKPAGRAVGWQILLLSYVGVASHPLLDSLNVYGMRWLMPFSGKWFYGDTLFIVDPWVWAVLIIGIVMARKRGAGSRERGADHPSQPSAGAGSREQGADGQPSKSNWPVLALVTTAVYVVLMAVSNVAGRTVVARSFAEEGVEVQRMMVAPVPLNPFVRRVVIEDPEVYRFGTLRWLARRKFTAESETVDRHPGDPAVAAALREPRARKFMSWARFPYFEVDDSGEGTTVHIGDARYTFDPHGSWAATTVSFGGRAEAGSDGVEGK